MLLSSLFGDSEALAVRYGPWKMSETPGVLFSSRESNAGVEVDVESSLSLSAVFAAVNLLSAVMAALPLAVLRRRGRNKDHATAHRAYRLLHSQYNPEMTSVIARRTKETHRLLWGNTYSEIAWDGGGNPAALWPLEPWRVKPDRDADGSLYYLVDGRRRVAPGDMLHVPLISFDGVWGASFIDYALESLGVAVAGQESAARFYGNDARPGGILKHAGTPNEKARNELKASWQQQHGGIKNLRRVGVLWGGWDYVTDQAFDAEKAQLLDSRRFSVEEVARWLNIPPHLLRDLSRATFSNIEHQGIDFVLYTLGPVLTMYEQEYDRKLLNPPDLYSKHNVNALLRGDSAARSAFYREMWNIGALSNNDIRDLEDQNPIAGGDTYFVPVNMQPLERAIREPEPEPTRLRGRPQAEGGAQGGQEQPAPGQGRGNGQPAEGMAAVRGLLQSTLRGLLLSVLVRLAKVEATALGRVAKKSGRLFAWLDEFYPKHETNLAEALAPIQQALAALGGGAGLDAGAAAAGWCRESREQLLELSGSATPAEFTVVAERMAHDWQEARPRRVVVALLPEGDEACPIA